ncbi:DUF5799 family protein [Halobacteria archaeon AArc-dxtr1]|nr:DUF5799 family protein [Halobacteria archaeon AArc-dxtr1]
MSDSWTDLIVSERMRVDQEFSSQVASSRFSSQEWSLVMTATEFQVEHPEDPERAQIVADTGKLDGILPELETVRTQMGGMGGPPGNAESGASSSSGGLLDAIGSALGFGGDGSDESGSGDEYADEREAAERLTAEYAEALQAELEANGRWDDVREAAAGSGRAEAGDAEAGDGGDG